MEQIKAVDIVKIIKACSENGVVELKLSDLEIKFGPHYQNYPKISYSVESADEPQAELEAADPRKPIPPPIDEDYELFNDPVKWDERMRGDQGDDES